MNNNLGTSFLFHGIIENSEGQSYKSLLVWLTIRMRSIVTYVPSLLFDDVRSRQWFGDTTLVAYLIINTFTFAPGCSWRQVIRVFSITAVVLPDTPQCLSSDIAPRQGVPERVRYVRPNLCNCINIYLIIGHNYLTRSKFLLVITVYDQWI